jgi:hypothetical protein
MLAVGTAAPVVARVARRAQEIQVAQVHKATMAVRHLEVEIQTSQEQAAAARVLSVQALQPATAATAATAHPILLPDQRLLTLAAAAALVSALLVAMAELVEAVRGLGREPVDLERMAQTVLAVVAAVEEAHQVAGLAAPALLFLVTMARLLGLDHSLVLVLAIFPQQAHYSLKQQQLSLALARSPLMRQLIYSTI